MSWMQIWYTVDDRASCLHGSNDINMWLV